MNHKVLKMVFTQHFHCDLTLFLDVLSDYRQNAAMTWKRVGKSHLISEDPFPETSLRGVFLQAFPLLLYLWLLSSTVLGKTSPRAKANVGHSGR